MSREQKIGEQYDLSCHELVPLMQDYIDLVQAKRMPNPFFIDACCPHTINARFMEQSATQLIYDRCRSLIEQAEHRGYLLPGYIHCFITACRTTSADWPCKDESQSEYCRKLQSAIQSELS